MRIPAFIVLLLSLAPSHLVADQPLPTAAKADSVLVLKKEHTFNLMRQGKISKTYKVALGPEAVGPKQRQGDHKTPEGEYVLDRRNAHSQFYRSIHVSYPNVQDRERARKLGVSP